MVLRKLSRRTEHRIAMLKNQVTSLLMHDAITTTLPKAKELRRVAEWMVTWSKKGYVAPGTSALGDGVKYRRLAQGWVKDKDTLRQLFSEMPVRFACRRGGYTRILKLGPRKGDSAPMARIEWVEWDSEAERIKHEELREARDAQRKQVREQVAATIRSKKHATGLSDVSEVGRMRNRAHYRSDVKGMNKLYASLQSRVDRAAARGEAALPIRGGPRAPEGEELPEEYEALKVKKNPFNKYGGRGLVPAKKPAEDKQ